MPYRWLTSSSLASPSRSSRYPWIFRPPLVPPKWICHVQKRKRGKNIPKSFSSTDYQINITSLINWRITSNIQQIWCWYYNFRKVSEDFTPLDPTPRRLHARLTQRRLPHMTRILWPPPQPVQTSLSFECAPPPHFQMSSDVTGFKKVNFTLNFSLLRVDVMIQPYVIKRDFPCKWT